LIILLFVVVPFPLWPLLVLGLIVLLVLAAATSHAPRTSPGIRGRFAVNCMIALFGVIQPRVIGA
jgi:hypothetical protein